MHTSNTDHDETLKDHLDNDKEELKQKLASIEHERWADWQKWMHQCAFTDWDAEGKTIYCYTEEQISRWDKQITTTYSELSDQEKASDMEQVDRYWHFIDQYTQSKLKAFAGDIEQAQRVLEAYVDDEEYSFDHHGYCQTHSLNEVDQRCVNIVAKESVQALKAIKGKYQL